MARQGRQRQVDYSALRTNQGFIIGLLVLAFITNKWWLVAFVIATLWVWQRYAVVQAGHRIAERRAHIAELIEARDALLAENTTLSSRARIECSEISVRVDGMFSHRRPFQLESLLRQHLPL